MLTVHEAAGASVVHSRIVQCGSQATVVASQPREQVSEHASILGLLKTRREMAGREMERERDK